MYAQMLYRLGPLVAETICAGAFILPIVWILDRVYFHCRKRLPLYFIFSLYLSAVFAVTGLPTIRSFHFYPNINYVPFADIREDLLNATFNIALFIPLGAMLPAIWNGFRKITATGLFGLCLSAAIEALQLFTFRATDINDVITNLTGTMLGYLLVIIVPKNTPKSDPPLRATDSIVLCLTSALVLYFVYPFISI